MAGGIAAGIVSTLVQIGLWLIFTDVFPAILWRDARLTAALLFGSWALVPTAMPNWEAMAAATPIHFGLSIVYSAVLGAATRQLPSPWVPIAGGLLGLGLYFINLYGFTGLFPWFALTRGWITLTAHLAFGVTAVVACRRLSR